MEIAIDTLHAFTINDSAVRGRIVRLGPVLDSILARHNYPYLVAHALAEALSVAAILASNLKSDGIFTIQVQSKGPVSLLVVDAVHGGAIRGYAQFDEQSLKGLKTSTLDSLFGEGYLAITLDQGGKAQRYQGIVPLEGGTLAEAIQNYFVNSQQIDVRLHIAIGGHEHSDIDHWLSGGIYIEKMPDKEGEFSDEDAWPRACALYETVRDDELLDPLLPLDQLLLRLFHEDGVWVQEPQTLLDQCRCSREKFGATLKGMGEVAIEEMMVDDVITATCQFCNTHHQFDRVDIKQLLNS